ncbi:TetR/AcrR family transcriptional regulator [Sphingobium sp. LB126]|uniref:TetR/AcrR family transcriptional regulator n=1 Tax=Sphingobium sp. LB126 TaxID=1983755 RepID=UPI0012FDF9A6|nr:TetR/AcrR family transcriptional regulator [Sphingobium sp. LB126]
MVKTWSDDNPKARLMERKRTQIVDAALKAFLESGYAEASVNHIADAAGVSIKTLYRHFESKAELFTAVMEAACGDPQDAPAEPAWYSEPPETALPVSGELYLRHALSPAQLALFRVVVRDAHRFPEIGRRYHEQTIGFAEARLSGYLDRWKDRHSWFIRDQRLAAQTFIQLLKAGFDDVMLGLRAPLDEEIVERARHSSFVMFLLFEAGRL